MNTIETKVEKIKANEENEVQLYSAFHRYDEIINCILSVAAILGGSY